MSELRERVARAICRVPTVMRDAGCVADEDPNCVPCTPENCEAAEQADAALREVAARLAERAGKDSWLSAEAILAFLSTPKEGDNGGW